MKVNINKELSKKMKQNYKTDADLSWTDFYMEFADKLRFYYDDRKTLIEKIRKIYADININLPTVEENNEIIDIDPFTVFGLFNKGISELNRKKL